MTDYQPEPVPLTGAGPNGETLWVNPADLQATRQRAQGQPERPTKGWRPNTAMRLPQEHLDRFDALYPDDDQDPELAAALTKIAADRQAFSDIRQAIAPNGICDCEGPCDIYRVWTIAGDRLAALETP